MGQALREMTNEQLVDECIRIDREQRKGRALLNGYKAELQARGEAIMRDRNIKYKKFYGAEGSVSIMGSMSLDILNHDRLKSLVGGGVYDMRVTEDVKTTYKLDAKFERALKALFMGDYTFEPLEEFLDQMSVKPDEKQKKVLLKKLKGEFEKDKETLLAVLAPDGQEEPDFDVELWFIYRIKNGELIKAFLPEEVTGDVVEAVRKCLWGESKSAITLDYDKEKETEE